MGKQMGTQMGTGMARAGVRKWVGSGYKVGVQPWMRFYLGFASSFWRRYNPLWLLIRVTR